MKTKARMRRKPRLNVRMLVRCVIVGHASSWLNLVELWFAEITTERIRRGIFKSVTELEQAIHDYIQYNNANPQSFVWTKSAHDIILKVNRGRAALGKWPLVRTG